MISNLREMRLHENVIKGYEESVTSINKKRMTDEWKKAEEYNKKIREDYENMLNLDGNGVMGYIEIPKIEVKLPIYHGSEEESLEKGIGHMEKTSLPVGGKGTHCVLTGHRGLPNAQLFTRLDELKEKDLIYISVLDKTLAYEVDQIQVVLPEEMKVAEINPEQDYITLVTCTPYSVNSHRLLVRGCRIEYREKETKQDKTGNLLNQNRKFLLIGSLTGILILLIAMEIYLWNRRKHKRRKCKKR